MPHARPPIAYRPHRSYPIHRLLALALVLLTVPLLAVPAAAGSTSPGAAPLLVNPTPQQLRVTGSPLALGRSVTVVAGEAADQAAVDAIRASLATAGLTSTVTRGTTTRAHTIVYVGTGPDDGGTATARRDLGADSLAGLAPEGYVLASGREAGEVRVVVSGVDAAGTFYGAQTLGQLLAASANGRRFPSVTIRDWPRFGIRGGMESFYGTPWTTQSREDQLRFLARNKLNTYFYGPAGDPQTGQTWNQPYQDQQLADLRQTVELAARLHIRFVYRISPENPLDQAHGICHARQADRGQLVARFEQLWSIGVRAYTIAWDDVAGHFVCPDDQTAFGADASPIAAAQASVDNYVINEFIRKHPGVEPLWTVPTEYFGNDKSTYRTRFDTLLDPVAVIYWTGPAVVSQSIGTADLAAAKAAFPRHQLLLWDNYPVNDYVPGSLLLAPLTGRSAGLENGSIGITFNEMQAQSPSQIPVATAADYAWNPEGYDATASWDRALRMLGGDEYPALRTFAENNSVGPVHIAGGPTDPAPRIGPAVAALRSRYDAGADLHAEAAAASRELTALADAAGTLAAGRAWPLFAQEAMPWLTRSAQLGRRGTAAVQALQSQHDGDHANSWKFLAAMQAGGVDLGRLPARAAPEAWRHSAKLLDAAPAPGTVTVAGGMIDGYLDRTRAEAVAFTGAGFYGATGTVQATPAPVGGSSVAAATDQDPLTAYRAGAATQVDDSLTVPLATARSLDAVVVLQNPSQAAQGMLNVHTPSGWRQLGPVHDGYTAVSAATMNGAPVDAIRIAWKPAQRPVVNEVIPVYTGALPASVSAPATVAALPGSARSIDVTVATATSGSINGTVTVQAPAGWAANTPTFSLVSDNRLVTSRASVSITAPATAAVGAYPVRLVATDAHGRAASTQIQVNVVRPPTDAYARMIFTDGPSAYWRLDESAGTTALDASGSGLDGAYSGSVQLSQPGSPASVPDEAVRLTGGYVAVPDNRALDLTGPFTLEAWVRPDHVAADPGDGIIEKYDTPAKNGYILRLAAGNLVQGWVLGASGYSYLTGATALVPNAWHHLALVYNGTMLTLYVDGHLDGETGTSVAPTIGAGSLKLGARGDDAAQRLPGSLDEVAIYPGALTAEQIARHAAG